MTKSVEMTKSVLVKVDPAGVAVITWDLPGRSMNVLDARSIEDFRVAVEQVLSDATVKGVVVTSGKKAFLAGADLSTITDMAPDSDEPVPVKARRIFDEVMILQNLYRRLETGGKPFVAAINGTALGGGFELCLACHHRIAADVPGLRVGLPEGSIGLLPGAGGTQRTLRMLGIERALPLLLDGTGLTAQEAAKMGLIDRVVPAAQLLDAACEWIKTAGAASATKPWDVQGFQPPGLNPRTGPGADRLAVLYATQRKKNNGNYPAQDQILRAVYEGALLPFDRALKVETWCFVRCMLSPVSRAMIRTKFVNLQKANKLERRPEAIPKQTVKRLGVLGAGMMGAAIAHVAALAGIEVVVIDRDQESSERALDHIRKFNAGAVAKGRMSEAAVKDILSRVKATTDYSELAGVPLVIEAVFEDRAVKADVTRKAQSVIGPDAVFASNTSTLPITGLAEAATHPEQFVGMHFFSPVERMSLVEVIVGKNTGAKAIAAAMDFSRQIGKTPIVVNDSRGFYTSRVFTTYWHESFYMLTEGISPALIENAGRVSGMPVPPLQICDEVTLELLHKVNIQTAKDLGSAYVQSPGMKLLQHMVEKEGRLGKKVRKGYYDHLDDGTRRLWPGLADLCPKGVKQPSLEAVRERLMDIQAIEAIRCLEEKVIGSPADGDVAALLGWGFAPWTGGPFSYVDMIGAKAFRDRCAEASKRYGERFRPPALLDEIVRGPGRFYPVA